ncbi:MAG TPA: hypothetical protein VGE76_12030 [Opitutaceae bacterium]
MKPARLLSICLLLLVGCVSEKITFMPSDAALLAQAKARELVPEILSGASELELFSIDPRSSRAEEGQPTDGVARLLGYKILGSTLVQNPATAQKLSEGLLGGMRASKGFSAMCFSPRHALRFRKDGSIVVFMICFECMKVEVAGDPRLQLFRTTGNEEAVFDAVLREAGIAKAP